ncbi:MAG TPA: peptide ABC transporter substrate-binding protein [Anaerolineae bacterium]|nr:peptide ABC transporter substrate-binding protein [Anaerolineae bacterium]
MTRYIRWQILLILLGGVLVGILLTYLSVNYTTVFRPGHGGTYVEGIAGYPQYLNPLLSGNSGVDRDICALMFSGLTRLNERGEVEADLARGWEVTLDGLTYTFYLRSNAYWHDGNPVTADDVVFTIGLLQDDDFPGPPELGASVWQEVTVEKVDRRTVRFMLSEPYAPFLDQTTVGILPSHLLRGIPVARLAAAQFNLNPVGSGPFQLAEIEVESGLITSMVLEQSSRYYGAQPYLDRIQFRFYPSDQTALSGYEAGEVEGIARITIPDLPRARALPSLNLFSAQMAEYALVFLNLGRPDLTFFQEPEVRQALLYALDRQQIIDEVLEGQAVVAHSPLVPGTWAYKDDIPHYEYAPDRANGLLNNAEWIQRAADGGLRRKDGQLLSFTLLTSSEPERMRTAQMLAEQWAAIGITVTVETASPLEVREALERRDFEAILVHLSTPGDPDPYPFWHQAQIGSGQNYAGFDHRRISEVIEQARVIANRERRKELYDEFQETFAQQVPALLLYVPIYTYGIDERIHDPQIGPLTYPSDRFRTISDWWIVPRRVFVSESEASRP